MKKILSVLLFSTLLSLGAGTVLSAADYQVAISFDVRVDSKSFIMGEPIVINLRVSNPKAMNAHYHNIAAGKAEKAVSEVTLGKPGAPWINSVVFKMTDSEGKIVSVKWETIAAGADKVTLGAENFAEHYFFIAPEECAKLKEGVYSIQAAVNNIGSNILTLNLLKEKGKLSGKDEISQILKVGSYHFIRGDFKKAEEYAKRVLSIDAHSLKGLHLLGDALTGLERYREAYDIFKKAVDEYFLQYPPPRKFSVNYRPPDLFFDKMRELKERFKR